MENRGNREPPERREKSLKNRPFSNRPFCIHSTSPLAVFSPSLALAFLHHVWQRSINRWQKVLRMKRVWWNCCIEMDAAAKQFLEERSSMLKC